jgi:hypothetical protein
MTMPGSCSIDGCGKAKAPGRRGLCGRHYQRWWRTGDPLGKRALRGAPMQFLESTFMHFEDGCIIWPFGRGYGKVWNGDHMVWVHPIVCERFNGKRPTPKHEAAHSCGNGHGGCINGYHLRWATRKENQADRINHGTALRGEQVASARLTESDVRSIRNLAPTETRRKIARRFGVDRKTIGKIIHRQRWKHVS